MPFACLANLSFYVASTALLITSLSAQTPNPAPPTTSQILSHLTPRMRDVILLYDAIKGTPLIDLTPQDARQQFSAQDAAKIIARGTGLAEAPMPVGKVIDGQVIPGPNGTQIPIRIYVPAGEGPFPVTLYFHGGGFVVATIDTYDASPRALCDFAKTLVVSVEYRKAPEAPFPAAFDDAVTSYKWVLAHIGQYGGNPKKVAVAGESAGGNLATEVAITARDLHLQAPTHQLLIYPVTSGNIDQPSNLEFTSSSLPLNTATLAYFAKLYLPVASEANDPRFAAINNDLSGLPPTTIIAAQFDPLVSDGEAYAAKLNLAQNKISYTLYPGTTHEFFGMGSVVPSALTAEQFASARLAASFQ